MEDCKHKNLMLQKVYVKIDGNWESIGKHYVCPSCFHIITGKEGKP